MTVLFNCSVCGEACTANEVDGHEDYHLQIEGDE